MKKVFLFVLALIITGLSAQAQQKQLPMDPDVTVGKLDNGLTYYIRKNAQPENRAEFYLVVNAGATLENPDQNGLAHFCEHMAFNGTEHFEKHDIINYLQSIGMKFGPEINAFTSHDVTAYMLQKVPTDVPENIDTSLLVLYDWAGGVSYEEEEIDNERGVIHEEWRSRRSPEFRMSTRYNKVLFKDSKYATHDVIGDIDIIDNFEYETLRSFYNDWYRPDLQAIIAVGDFDPQLIEEKIKEQFSQRPAVESPRPRTYSEVPGHEETLIAVETDPEATNTMVQVYYKHNPVTEKGMDYYRESLKQQLYNSMVNARLGELLQQESNPFIYGFSAYTSLVRTKDAYILFALAKSNQALETLETMITENQKVKRYGFTEGELERAKADVLAQLEKQYNDRNKRKSAEYVWEYFGNFLENEPVPGAEFDYKFTQEELPGISLDEMNQLAKNWITDENRVVVITGPEKEDVAIPTSEEVLATINKADNTEVEAYVDKFVDRPLVEEVPQAGTIVSSSVDEELGTTRWTFENGVQVVLKPTDFKDDEILMSAYSLGGTSLYPNDELISAQFASDIADQSGLGAFDRIALDKALSGKVVRLNNSIRANEEGISGSTTPKDLETMLQLVYLNFTDPRIDDAAFKAFMSRIKAVLKNRSSNPMTTLMDSAQVIGANYHPRVRPMTAELLEEANADDMRYIFEERFGDPSGFTFYFVGNIDPEKAKPLISTYIGGLPKVKRNETYKDHSIRPPEGTIEKTFKRPMETPKATVYIEFNDEFDYDNAYDRMLLSSVIDVLDIRYTETIREEEGGTYGVRCSVRQSKFPYEHYTVTIYFDCDPENAENLKNIVYREIEKLKKEGPVAKDLKGVKENLLKTYRESLKENRSWLKKLQKMDKYGTPAEEYKNYEKMVEKMSAKDIKKAAKRFFGKDHIELILLPESTENSKKNPMLDKQG